MTAAQEQLLLELARFNIITMRPLGFIDPHVLQQSVDKVQDALTAVTNERRQPNYG